MRLQLSGLLCYSLSFFGLNYLNLHPESNLQPFFNISKRSSFFIAGIVVIFFIAGIVVIVLNICAPI